MHGEYHNLGSVTGPYLLHHAWWAVPVSQMRLRIIKVEQTLRGHKAGKKQGKDTPMMHNKVRVRG